MTPPPDDDKPLWFFMSYSRGDGQHLFGKFFKLLADEVLAKAALPSTTPPTDIGFRDVEGIRTGERWQPMIESALGRSYVFLSFMSEGFFRSRYCGREYQAFANRLERTHPGDPPPLILPLLWEEPELVTPSSLPVPIKALQVGYEPNELGEGYTKHGLKMIMRLHQHEDARIIFVSNLAKTIVLLCKAHELAPGPIDPLKDLASAFHSVPNVTAGVGAGGPAPPVVVSQSRRTVQFAFLAARRSELQGTNLTREIPRLCRGGTQSLTFTGVQ